MLRNLRYWIRLLAGGTFGFYVGHLLYLLNPQIEISLAKLAGITVLYASIGALLFGNALWLLHLLKRRILPSPDEEPEALGLVALAAFLAAVLFYFHLVSFRVYLPRGAVRALSSSTIIVTSTAFLLFLLWVVQRSSIRRSARAGVIILLAIVVTSSVFLFQRRERYRVDQQEPAVAEVGAIAGKHPILLIVLEDLPIDWLITAGAEGALPTLEQLRTGAFSIRVEPFPTTGLPPLWASLATGQLPHRHGVTGRYAYETATTESGQPYLILPSAVGFKAWGLIPPIHRISARLPAGDSAPVWECFRRAGLESQVYGWQGLPAPAPVRVQLPSQLQARIATEPARVRDQIESAARTDAASVAAAARALRKGDLDLSSVWLTSIGRTQRALSIRDNRLPDRGSANGGTVREALSFVDGLVRELIEARPDALVVVTSTSGHRPPPLPGNHIPVLDYLNGIRDPGSEDGFVILAGPPFVTQQRRESIEVVDVVPTILFTAGLPVARDMDGRVLTEAFRDEELRGRSLMFIGTYLRP